MKRLARRRLLQAGLSTGAALALGCDAAPARLRRRVGHAFGTTVAIAVAAGDAEQALDAAFAEIRAVERVTDLFRPVAELARLNRDGQLDDPSPVLLDLLRMAQALHAASDGLFDVTIQPLWRLYAETLAGGRLPDAQALAAVLPKVDGRGLEIGPGSVRLLAPGMGVTLNALAQGYATDQVLARLRSLGVTTAFVDTGELGLLGRRPDGRPWTVALDALPGALTRPDGGCLATSSDAELAFTPDRRLHHILDPRTGLSPGELASATVLAQSGLLADGLSTALMLVGPSAGLRLLAAFPGSEALMVKRAGGLVATAGFPLA
jgi:thiamine biosynthesis lipoprotein